MDEWPTEVLLKDISRLSILKLFNVATIYGEILAIIFWEILMFDKILVSPKVKRIVIISNKHGIYQLPHEFPNDLRLKTLGN